MNRRKPLGVLTAVVVSLSLAARAADDPKPPAPPERPTGATPAPPARPAPPAVAPGGNPWSPGFYGAQQQQPWARFALWQTISLVTEMNMTAEFTLSADQKAKIIAIRAAAKKEQDDWREAHAPEFKGFQDEMMALRGNDPATREKWGEIGRAQAELMASAPKEDEPVAQVRAVLTNEQLKLLEAEENRRKAEAERQQKEMMERWREQMAKQPQPQRQPLPPTPTPKP